MSSFGRMLSLLHHHSVVCQLRGEMKFKVAIQVNVRVNERCQKMTLPLLKRLLAPPWQMALALCGALAGTVHARRYKRSVCFPRPTTHV